MHLSLRHRQSHLAVEVRAEGSHYRVTVDGHEHLVEAVRLDSATLALVIDGRQYRVDQASNGCERFVAVAGEVYTFVTESSGASAHSVATVAAPEVVAPMPGKVLQILVQAGDRVEAGDGLLILEAMKMENRLVAEAAGTVAEVRVADGDMVEGGQVLVVLTYDEPA